ncbi:MAG: hypothetical protein JW797_17755 [Bradymonadales bacterium]|nr:hypothetical protein [Bradymonadales bacterium]
MAPHRLRSLLLLLWALGWAPACNQPPEGVLGVELIHGTVGVMVTGYELRYLELQADNGAVLTTQAPLLLIHLDITNHGQSSLRYDTRDAVMAAQQAQTPLLFVDPGQGRDWRQAPNVALISPGAYRYLGDPVTAATVIAPGETIHDVLLFENPPVGTAGLVLSLPPSLFGQEVQTPVLLRIAYAASQPIRPPVGSVGEEIQGDGYVFRLDRVQVAYLPNEAHTGFTEPPVLAVEYTLRNTSQQALIYRPAHRDPAGVTAPALAAGDYFFDRVMLPNNQQIRGQLVTSQTIPPNAEVQDMAVFARPDSAFNELTFYFRGHNLGRTGQIRVRFPYTYLDPPLPVELQEPQPPPLPTGSEEAPCDDQPPAEESVE